MPTPESHIPPRSRFRLVDALIALGICGIVAAFLAAPIVRLRGDAKRAQSQGRLAQLALATHNYRDAHAGKYPALVAAGNSASDRAGLKSFFFELLPFLEAEDIYRLYDPANPATYHGHSSTVFPATTFAGGAANQWLRMFVSPADDTMPEGLRNVVGGYGVASTDTPWTPTPLKANTLQPGYFAGREPSQPFYYAPSSYAANAIALGSNPKQSSGSFPDGAATTILLAERPQRCGGGITNLWGFGGYSHHSPTFGLLTTPGEIVLPSTGQVAPVLPLPPNWSSARVPIRVGRTDAPIQAANFDRPFQLVRDIDTCDPRLPGTPHASGMLVAMADGSVRAVNPNVSAWTFWAACTPDGNEALGEDW